MTVHEALRPEREHRVVERPGPVVLALVDPDDAVDAVLAAGGDEPGDVRARDVDASSHIRSHNSSQPPNAGADRAHAFDGYSETNTSGSTASRAPRPAASARSPAAFSTVASASRMTGVAWIAATRTVPKAGMGRA